MNFASTIRLNKTGVLLFSIGFVLLIYYVYNRDGDKKIRETELIDLKTLLQLAILAAEQGGQKVIYYKNNMEIKSKGKTKEGANDSVTTADFKSHCAMVGILKKSFPEVTLVSEETVTCDRESSEPADYADIRDVNIANNHFAKLDEVTIWIDPLDATQEYTEGLTEYVTTMVCIAVNGLPIVGVIHKPFEKETFWGWKDVKTSDNLMAPIPDENGKVNVIVSRSHAGKVEEMLKRSKISDYAVRPAGGAGYKVLEVTKGSADVYIHVTNIKKWDICAGNAILNAMGGKMTDLNGKFIDYKATSDHVLQDGVVAAFNLQEEYRKMFVDST